jgi:hypothetical protein
VALWPEAVLQPVPDAHKTFGKAARLLLVFVRNENGREQGMVMNASTVLTAAAALIADNAGQAASLESTSATTTYHSVTIDGVGVFYREAGPKEAPTLVLLHGFPSSSREFDTLIPLLATHYHLIAPDFPGFGQSDTPSPSSYPYTFDQLAKTTSTSERN